MLDRKTQIWVTAVSLFNDEGDYYTVIYGGKNVGMIWQESPDLFPDCWTIGISLEDANSTMSLDKCKEYLERTYPGIQMELKTKLDQKHDIQP